MTRPKVLLDCDPGIDDMFAIFCALRYCDLVGVTSVAGNVGIDHTTRNALALLELCGTDVPVFRGASSPLAGHGTEDARHVHGDTGLGRVTLPPPSADSVGDATSALFDLTADGDVTVVAVGPLTNLARAIALDPTWVDRVPRVVIMGGSTTTGNVTPFGEFNIVADPEAAALVFDSGVALTMAGLNLTRQVTMGADDIAALRRAGTPTALLAADALDFYSDFSLGHYGIKQSAMHDPCAVLEVVRPDFFDRGAMQVDVEVRGEYTRGMTVCDQRVNARSPDTDVLIGVDAPAVVEAILTATVEPLGTD